MPQQAYDISGLGFEEGYAIAYFFDCVLVGTVSDNQYRFCREPNWDKLQELHVFNEKKEYRAVFSLESGWLVRMQDDATQSRVCYDEVMAIIGGQDDKPTGTPGFYEASEAGRAVILPIEVRGKGIKVRNYVRFEDIGDGLNERCCLDDWRFCGFAQLKGGDRDAVC